MSLGGCNYDLNEFKLTLITGSSVKRLLTFLHFTMSYTLHECILKVDVNIWCTFNLWISLIEPWSELVDVTQKMYVCGQTLTSN